MSAYEHVDARAAWNAVEALVAHGEDDLARELAVVLRAAPVADGLRLVAGVCGGLRSAEDAASESLERAHAAPMPTLAPFCVIGNLVAGRPGGRRADMSLVGEGDTIAAALAAVVEQVRRASKRAQEHRAKEATR